MSVPYRTVILPYFTCVVVLFFLLCYCLLSLSCLSRLLGNCSQGVGVVS